MSILSRDTISCVFKQISTSQSQHPHYRQREKSACGVRVPSTLNGDTKQFSDFVFMATGHNEEIVIELEYFSINPLQE
jgi:hypothetical protein